MEHRSYVADAQRKWLKERNACGDDTAFPARAYRSRINALSEVLDTIATHGSLAEPHIIVKRGQRASPL
jgi:uncharacterized protein